EPRLLQDLEVLDDGGKGHVERPRQVADRRFPFGELGQNGPPRRVGEGGERRAQVICLHSLVTNKLTNLLVIYGRLTGFVKGKFCSPRSPDTLLGKVKGMVKELSASGMDTSTTGHRVPCVMSGTWLSE